MLVELIEVGAGLLSAQEGSSGLPETVRIS
jgi:hypothetical protein